MGVDQHLCALPLNHVIETMRPLPVETIPDMPAFVTGVSIVRGIPTPVVSLGALLGTSEVAPARFVTLKMKDRQVALAVQNVLGIRQLQESAIQNLPPLLRKASKEFTAEIGVLDEQLLIVLSEGWQLPEDVWRVVSTREDGQ